MPEKDPKNSAKPQPEARKPANRHGMEEYEEVFRRTDNPYQRINPHWPAGEDRNNPR